jgi:hypothetical protein
LLAHAQWLADAMRLRGLGEAGADQQAAVLRPSRESRAAGVLVAVELFEQRCRDLRDVLAGAIADDLALHSGALCEGGQGREQRGEQDGAGTRVEAGHGGFPKPG